MQLLAKNMIEPILVQELKLLNMRYVETWRILFSLIYMFALSSVIGKKIYALYLEEITKETKYGLCDNGLIKPKTYNEMFKNRFDEKHGIILLWTKDGSRTFVSRTSKEFKPNHF